MAGYQRRTVLSPSDILSKADELLSGVDRPDQDEEFVSRGNLLG